MKRLNCILMALFMTSAPIAAHAVEQKPEAGTSFERAYEGWKSEFNMSAFTSQEDNDIKLRSRSGDCGLHIFFMDVIAEKHMSMPLPQKRNSQYYTRMKNFYDICQVSRKGK